LGLLDLFQAGGPLSLRPARQLVKTDEDLFDDEFQRKLDYLALVSRKVFAGRMRAERRTKKSGSGIEFADHRDYQPGDDFRYLDWNVYQKFGRLLLRLYEEDGPAAVDRLNGQWAFAIWNSRSRTLFLSRDPIGVPP